jgi:predicted RNA-binding Zn-ribbon protein involved in translation (DUF1610 family)
MTWDCDPLWAKAKLYFGRAFEARRDDPVFGLWCSLGLELLGRAALASVSPTLLAHPQPDMANLLHALKQKEISKPRSVNTAQVFLLCKVVFKEFTDQDLNICNALINQRNEELHSGSEAFDDYGTSNWLVGFYHASQSLCSAMKRTLVDLFGKAEAEFAEQLLAENRDELIKRVKGLIGDRKKYFEALPSEERTRLGSAAEQSANELSAKRHHKVACPACGCAATVQGIPFGKEHVSTEEDEIVVRQAVSPTEFSCPACGLRYSTYAELEMAALGEPYTRTTRSSPEEYYGLIHPDQLDSYVEDYLRDQYNEYDNE